MCRYRKRKAQMGLMLVFVIFIIGIISFFITDQLILGGVLVVKNNILISMAVDDRGTEFLALMDSSTTGKGYIEILGGMLATNAPGNYGEDVKATLDKMHEEYSFALQFSGMADIEFGRGDASGGDEYQVTIPAPGAQGGKTTAFVRIRR